MSISSIAGTALNSLLNLVPRPQSGHGNSQQIQSEFQQLGKDLQAGNLTQAKQDYATIQQDFQQQQQQGAGQVHHHYHHGGGAGPQTNEISQALNSLSTALQSNNLSSAQAAFATLQQDLQQFTEFGGSSSTTGATPSYAAAGSLNVTA